MQMSFKPDWEQAAQRFEAWWAGEVLDRVCLQVYAPKDNVTRQNIPTPASLEERQRVRAVGLSCHSLPALKAAAENPWVEVILARLNYDGMLLDATPAEVIPVLHTAQRNGKAVYGMKIFGEGKLKDNPEKCIRYAFETGVIPAMTIGMMSEEEIKQDAAIVRGLFPKT